MLKDLFKKKEKNNIDTNILIASLLIHAARIDENYTDIERKIITKAIIDLNKLIKNLIKQSGPPDICVKIGTSTIRYSNIGGVRNIIEKEIHSQEEPK